MPEDRTLLLGHSPDPDDAFMFYGLAADRIPTPGWRFEHILQDIQTLNERAVRGELHLTAISIHAYPYVADRYALTTCGASMGDRYGPLLVARQDLTPKELIGKTIAVPGQMTTAYLVLNLLLGKGRFAHHVVRFDQILDRVASGEFEAGLIIHEGQLTYHKQALSRVLDLGQWWHEQTGLPLPLGGNCIRRDLGADAMREVTGILKRSIEFSLAHRTEAVQHAFRYARDMGSELADEFIGMYVNDWTLDYGDVGRRAVTELLSRGAEAGVVPPVHQIDFVSGV
jgi:1,4-dihydroxy-6-naphthoate synthase